MSAPLSTGMKALGLVLFLGAIAGATYAVQTSLGIDVATQLVSVDAERGRVNATPGQDVTFLVTVSNRDTTAREVIVTASGAATGSSDATTVRGGSNATLFLTVSVPDGLAPGDHAVDVRLESEGRVFRERDGLLTVHVLPSAPGFQDGDAARVTYTGRLAATGRVFNTNDAGLVGLSVPKTETYRFSEGELSVLTRPRVTVVQGFYEGMLGMQPGETRTFTIPPEKAYGPATEEESFARDEIIDRELSLNNTVQNVTRTSFDAYVTQTRQGNGTDFEPGDIFLLDQNRALWPYRVVSINETTVEYQLGAEVGDAFTIFPFWQNASVVTSIDNTTVVFRTTPPVDQPFSWIYPGGRILWPDMSRVESVNETSIVVRHSPPPGFSFAYPTPGGGQPRQASVKDVGEETIVVAIPAANPLAGRDLTYDVTLLSLERG